MKKHLCLLLSALLLLTLAGCGGEAALPTEPVATVAPAAPGPAGDSETETAPETGAVPPETTSAPDTAAPETEPDPETEPAPETTAETTPAAALPAYTDEAGMRDFLAGTWTFHDPAEAGDAVDLELRLEADGTFEATRRAPTLAEGLERYRGTWSLERVDARPTDLPDGLSLTLGGRYEDLDSFGDYAITGLYTADGGWTMELSQVNEGEGVFSMYYYTYTPVLQRQAGAD